LYTKVWRFQYDQPYLGSLGLGCLTWQSVVGGGKPAVDPKIRTGFGKFRDPIPEVGFQLRSTLVDCPIWVELPKSYSYSSYELRSCELASELGSLSYRVSPSCLVSYQAYQVSSLVWLVCCDSTSSLGV